MEIVRPLEILNLYRLAYTNPILWLAESTRTLNVQTTDPAQVGSHTIMFTAQLEDHPFTNPVTTVVKYFNVIIEAYCHETIFEYEQPSPLYHEVGNPVIAATTYTFDAIKDSVSMTTGSTIDGLTYCRARTYTFDGATQLFSDDHTAGSIPQVVTFVEGTRTFTLDGTDESQFGKYKVTFSVGLDEYPGLTPKDFSFWAYVTPPCT
jgi:hypothetical protein